MTAGSRLLRDGSAVELRRLQHEDREGLRLAFLELSAESRYARFLSAVPRLSSAMLDTLVDRVDDVDHVARLLVRTQADGESEDIGVGRFVRDPLAPDRAEVAFTVADDRHGIGAGSALCDGLVAAALDRGVHFFTATVLADNVASVHLLERAGTIVSRLLVHPGTLEVVVHLQPPPVPPPVLRVDS